MSIADEVQATCDLLEDLAAELALPEIEPDEITVQMLAKRTGKSENACRDRLNAGLELGELTWRWVKSIYGRVRAYRRANR